jgi:microcystin-dependent protein
MAEPFLAEIRLMSFNFPPKGWAMCNGQLLPINQNQPLFALLGTTYGGNGQTNFALPNFQGRVPMHFGKGFTLGQQGGEYAHTLTQQEMTTHMHFVNAKSTATGGTSSPSNNFLGGGNNVYHDISGQQTPMRAASIGNTGGSQAHNNTSPFLTITFCIALQGIFPSPN